MCFWTISRSVIYQIPAGGTKNNLFHPVSNFNTLRHQFESGKTQKTAGLFIGLVVGVVPVGLVVGVVGVAR
jgi:hypothetical protein